METMSNTKKGNVTEMQHRENNTHRSNMITMKGKENNSGKKGFIFCKIYRIEQI